MANEKMVSLLPIHTVVRKPSEKAPEERYAPGPKAKAFEVPEVEAERLIRLGAAKLADEESEEDDDPGLTVPELRKRAAALKVDMDAIKGSGKGGKVVKADLVQAVDEAEAEAAARAAGATGNPSIVE